MGLLFAIVAVLTVIVAIVTVAVVSYKRYLEGIDSDRTGFRIVWGWKVYDYTARVTDALRGASPYKNLYPPSYLEEFCTTPDDPIMAKIASWISADIDGFSDFDKANFILKFVQKSIAYQEDEENYGMMEMYVLPVNTLIRKRGDCEDVSFLYANLCNLCGLDAVNVRTPGHMTTGVCVPLPSGKKAMKWTIDGKTYYHAEATSQKLIGDIYVWFTSCVYIRPQVPTEYFMSLLEPYEY